MIGPPGVASGDTLALLATVSPWLMRPVWAEQWAKILEDKNRRKVVFSAPVQHGKTTVTLHALAWKILREPDLRFAYITYSQERANQVSLEMQRILEDCGLSVRGTLAMIRWDGGRGSLMMTSIDGGITGQPIDGTCVIDDPVKNIQEATSPVRRRVILETFRTSIINRAKGSVVVMATRWDLEDLSGTLIKSGWENINVPAIAEENDPLGREIGEALFPEVWSIDRLREIEREMTADFFSALYQGRPRARGNRVFGDPTYYTELPSIYQGGMGIDLAFTASTSGDWSVCVQLLREQRADGPMFYVRWVDRARVDATSFALMLKTRHTEHKSWPMMWRNSGGEKGVARFIRQCGVPLRTRQATSDKFVNAIDIAALWKAGRILVPDLEVFPECSIWLGDFLTTLLGFTGAHAEIDDDVDALVDAHYVLRGQMDQTSRQLPAMRI